MLIYSSIASLDGYTADAEGKFDWAEPDAEVFALLNDLERGVGTYLYGRRMYEVMLPWETMSVEDESPVVRDWTGIWRAADKIVYSTTLQTVFERQNPDRAPFRPGGYPGVERTRRHIHRRPESSRVGDTGRAGRRVPVVRHARDSRRWDCCLP